MRLQGKELRRSPRLSTQRPRLPSIRKIFSGMAQTSHMTQQSPTDLQHDGTNILSELSVEIPLNPQEGGLPTNAGSSLVEEMPVIPDSNTLPIVPSSDLIDENTPGQILPVSLPEIPTINGLDEAEITSPVRIHTVSPILCNSAHATECADDDAAYPGPPDQVAISAGHPGNGSVSPPGQNDDMFTTILRGSGQSNYQDHASASAADSQISTNSLDTIHSSDSGTPRATMQQMSSGELTMRQTAESSDIHDPGLQTFLAANEQGIPSSPRQDADTESATSLAPPQASARNFFKSPFSEAVAGSTLQSVAIHHDATPSAVTQEFRALGGDDREMSSESLRIEFISISSDIGGDYLGWPATQPDMIEEPTRHAHVTDSFILVSPLDPYIRTPNSSSSHIVSNPDHPSNEHLRSSRDPPSEWVLSPIGSDGEHLVHSSQLEPSSVSSTEFQNENIAPGASTLQSPSSYSFSDSSQSPGDPEGLYLSSPQSEDVLANGNHLSSQYLRDKLLNGDDILFVDNPSSRSPISLTTNASQRDNKLPNLDLPENFLSLSEELSPLFSPDGVADQNFSTVDVHASQPLHDQIDLPRDADRTLFPMESRGSNCHLRSSSSPKQSGKRRRIDPVDKMDPGVVVTLPDESNGKFVDVGIQTDNEKLRKDDEKLRKQIRHLKSELRKARASNRAAVENTRPMSLFGKTWNKIFPKHPESPPSLQTRQRLRIEPTRIRIEETDRSATPVIAELMKL